MARTGKKEEERTKKVIDLLVSLGAVGKVTSDGYSFVFSTDKAVIDISDQKFRVIATIWRKPKGKAEELLLAVWRESNIETLKKEIREEIKKFFYEHEVIIRGRYPSTFKKVLEIASVNIPD